MARTLGGVKAKFPKTGELLFDGPIEGQPLPVLPDGKPPSEIRIFAAGVNPSDYGPITFDAKAAEAVMEAQKRKNNPLFIDWNHGHAVPKEKRTREQGESAGEFALEVRDGELWAKGIQWTEAGADSVGKRKYNLFSPWFAFERDERDDVTRPTCLMNFALVNRAGLDNLQRIAAEAATGRDDDMKTAEQIQAELDKATQRTVALEAEVATLKAKDSTRGTLALGAVLGLAADATDEVRVSAVRGLVKVREDVLALTAKTSDAEAIGVLRAWKGNADEVATIRAEAAAKTALALTAEFDGIVETAVKDLKVDVAKKADFRANELARMGGTVTAEGVAQVKTLVAFMNPKGNATGRGPTAPASAGPQEITAEQKNLLTLHGIKVESAERAIATEALYTSAKAAQLEGRG